VGPGHAPRGSGQENVSGLWSSLMSFLAVGAAKIDSYPAPRLTLLSAVYKLTCSTADGCVMMCCWSRVLVVNGEVMGSKSHPCLAYKELLLDPCFLQLCCIVHSV